jgi:hypothetical protein
MKVRRRALTRRETLFLVLFGLLFIPVQLILLKLFPAMNPDQAFLVTFMLPMCYMMFVLQPAERRRRRHDRAAERSPTRTEGD